MEEKEFTYKIGEKEYTQRQLVWGQVRQLALLLKDVSIGDDLSEASLISSIGDRIHKALAIVLTEKGASVKDKDLVVCATELEFNIDLDMIMRVIEDFFVCNPIISILEKLSGAVKALREKVTEQVKEVSPTS